MFPSAEGLWFKRAVAQPGGTYYDAVSLTQNSLYSSAKLRFNDALVAASTDPGASVDDNDNTWVISSPNMDWVPEVCLGRAFVTLCEDGWFGSLDPIQWPQRFSLGNYVHLSLIQHKPDDSNDPKQIIWWKPTRDDFVPIDPNSANGFGRLSLTRQNLLRPHVRDATDKWQTFSQNGRGRGSVIEYTESRMRTAFARLNFPSTYRDIFFQVRTVQRNWLELFAWFEWCDVIKERANACPSTPFPVNRNYIGTYTNNPEEAERLYAAGVPVWFFRRPVQITDKDIIQEKVYLSEPRDIVTKPFSISKIQQVARIGEHFEMIAKGPHCYVDIDKVIYPNFDKVTMPRIGDSNVKPPVPIATPHNAPLRTRRVKHRGQPCKYIHSNFSPQ